MNLHIRDGFDEFEDEPEDELASRGMHVVEGDDDEDEEKKAEAIDDDVEVVEVDVVEEVDADAEAKEKEYKDGLEELEEMERTYVESSAISFGSAEEPDEV